ncbi:MAG: BamA/TamA family outer membrane protein, partial [Pseudomonadales bacterium]|nr:BamA/TamA family outer membrane protein [Pseudomonadales bacterium]
FDKTEIAIERGYEAIMSKSSRLAQFASRSATTPPRPGHFQPPVITGIEVDNETRVSDRLIRAQIRQAIGKRLDESQLRHDIDTIYGYEYFDSVFYDIIPGENGSVLRVSAREQSRSRNLLGISFELFSDTGTESGYNLGASFRKSDVTTRGGEWFTAAQVGQDPRIRTEFYLPLDFRQHYFLRPYIEYGERRFNQIAAENIDARFRINELLYGLFAGYEISNKAIAGFGYERHDGDIKSYVGSGPSGEFDDSLNYLLAEYDDVDSISFPHEGTLATLRYDFVDPSGAPRYNMFDARVLHAFPVGGQSIVFSGRYHRSGSLFVSRHLQPSLGGFGNLSGLHRDSLVGNNLTYVGVTWLHRLTERRLLPVDLPVYLALSIEAGNTWQDSADIDAGDLIYGGLLSLGVDTPFGPVYLGYGRAEIGNGTFYIRLGHLF